MFGLQIQEDVSICKIAEKQSSNLLGKQKCNTKQCNCVA